MTVKEAILKVLEGQTSSLTANNVCEFILQKGYVDWSNSKTPLNTVNAQLGDFIKRNDSRVKRIKKENKYEYYLSKYENKLNLTQNNEREFNQKVKLPNSKTYHERDLHILLSSFLKNKDISSKTVYHEKSTRKDKNQKWVHPDMIGIDFLQLKDKGSNSLLKAINKSDMFNLISYELKKEIKTDYDLKECYFQAVSNSSWANFGYLVTFGINQNLRDEMQRLNQSFGIGIIELKAKVFESEVLFPAKYRELDFKTIDKLCIINEFFKKFISHTEKILTASDKYLQDTQKGFEEFCDDFFTTDSEIEKYCKEKNIPYEQDIEIL